ncbi:uncharacterized protein [Oscarella lobularis]|uniref:uncharacterized protein isoform X2 n=1 Tax=Oscarella lobularis TaxID=121494 RepID=UPI003313FF22
MQHSCALLVLGFLFACDATIPTIVHDQTNDFYDPKNNAAVAQLRCDYTAFCTSSCDLCTVEWDGVHQGQKLDMGQSNTHIVNMTASAGRCFSYLTIMWRNKSDKHSFYECKVTNNRMKTVVSKPHTLRIKIALVAAVKNVTAVPENDIEVFCPSAHPIPPRHISDVRCSWWKDDQLLPTMSAKYRHDHRPTLLIRNATKSDIGKYRCKLRGRGITTDALEYSYAYLQIANLRSVPRVNPLEQNRSTCFFNSTKCINHTEERPSLSTQNQSELLNNLKSEKAILPTITQQRAANETVTSSVAVSRETDGTNEGDNFKLIVSVIPSVFIPISAMGIALTIYFCCRVVVHRKRRSEFDTKTQMQEALQDPCIAANLKKMQRKKENRTQCLPLFGTFVTAAASPKKKPTVHADSSPVALVEVPMQKGSLDKQNDNAAVLQAIHNVDRKVEEVLALASDDSKNGQHSSESQEKPNE